MWSLSSLRKLNSSSSIGINGGFKCISHVSSRLSSGYGNGGGYNETDVNSKPQDNLDNMNSQDNLRGPMPNNSSRDFYQGTMDAFHSVGGGRGMDRNFNPRGNFRGPMTNFSSQYNSTGSQDYFGRPAPNVEGKNILQESMNAILAGGDSRNSNTWRNRRSTNFIRGTLEQDRFAQRNMNQDRFAPYSLKQDAHVVLIQLRRNNTHINVTDHKGATKFWTASGNKNIGGGGKTRFAAEATAEFVGRKLREMGVKSAVVRVKGPTYFKKKRQAIMSLKEGYSNSRSDASPFQYIEDATQRPHNGCRLPKKRRI